MAFDAFLKIATIPGESTDSKHKDWIEVLSFSTGVSNAGAFGTGGGGGAERAVAEDFAIMKYVDTATPKLSLACCSGKHIAEAVLEVVMDRGSTGKKVAFMEYKMTDILIRSVHDMGTSKSNQIATAQDLGKGFLKEVTLPLVDDLPSEQLQFSFSKIEWTFEDENGKTTQGGWDFLKNAGT